MSDETIRGNMLSRRKFLLAGGVMAAGSCFRSEADVAVNCNRNEEEPTKVPAYAQNP